MKEKNNLGKKKPGNFIVSYTIQLVMVVYCAKFGLNIFISNQSNDMHIIFTYNDTLMGLELKQHAY